MNKFAFVVHPVSVEQFKKTLRRWNPLKYMPLFILKQILPSLKPYIFLDLKKIKSKNGQEIEGYLIMCPMTPDQMVGKKSRLARKRVIQAAFLAKKRGAAILGLAGFTSIITGQGVDIRKEVDIAVTSGNTYTAALAVDAVLQAVNQLGLGADDCASIIGATGDIGSICAKSLAGYFNKLILVGRNQEKLRSFAQEASSQNKGCHVYISTRIRDALEQAAVILTATSATVPIVSSCDLSPGAVVCDISYPPNIHQEILEERKDVLVFEGGISDNPWYDQLTKNEKKLINIFNFKRTLHGCAAETILLCFEGLFDSKVSLGRGKIALSDLDFMRSLALKHGLKYARFYVGDKIYSSEDIENIKLRNRHECD